MREPKLIRTCSIWRALEVVGDTSTLLILEACWIGARRFEALRERTGLQRALLSDRLGRLVDAGILRKVAYSSAPPRFEYRLTRKGQDLYWPALMMRRWERRWSPRDGKLDIVLRHRTCGEAFEPTPSCLCCGDEVTARDVDWTEGPGVGWMAASYSRRRQQRAAAAERDAPTALLDEAAQIAGDRWASLVLRSIFTGIRRFDDIRRDTAMASNILAERLLWLAGKGVIRAEARDPASARHEYRLTEKGVDYYPILLMLLQWGDAYYVAAEGPPLLLRHRGHDLLPAVTCSCCAEPVRPQDVTFEVVEAAPAPLAAVS
ncbi:MAG: helix-turn-helix domain-containing protein [Pseudomonadota bacterium]